MGTRIGEMKCTNPLCSCTDVAVEVTSAGNWQSRCHKCLIHTYSKAGTRWRRDMETLVTLDDEPAEPTPKAPAPPALAPAVKPASVFSLGQL